MAGERFVVAGLARARTDWFRAVASWSTSGALPTEFVGCVSAEELRAQTSAGRPFSAALLDAGLPSVDRDLVALLREEGVAPIFVETVGVSREWRDLGAAAVLPASFERSQLLDALRAVAQPIGHGDVPRPDGAPDEAPTSNLAPVISICGPGGTGASSLAIALAQGLAPQHAANSGVLLADLCRRADQAALHDARDIVPGVQELVEAHRNRRLTAQEVRALTFQVTERGYNVLLGLRRPSNWTAVRPRAFQASLQTLRETFSVVVADIEPDLEGEKDSGAVDVEERNVMASTAVAASSVVLVVGRRGLSGMAGMVRTIEELHTHGVDPARILPVCSPGPKQAVSRSQFVRALTQTVSLPPDTALPGMVFVPRRRIDEALWDGVGIPRPIPRVLARSVTALMDRLDHPHPSSQELQLVVPGSLGVR